MIFTLLIISSWGSYSYADSAIVLGQSIEFCGKAHQAIKSPSRDLIDLGWKTPSLSEITLFADVRSEAKSLPIVAAMGQARLEASNEKTKKLIEKARRLYFAAPGVIKESFDSHPESEILIHPRAAGSLAEVLAIGDLGWKCTFYGTDASLAVSVLGKTAIGINEKPHSVAEMGPETSGIDFRLHSNLADKNPIGFRFAILNPDWITRGSIQPFQGQFLIETQSKPEWLEAKLREQK